MKAKNQPHKFHIRSGDNVFVIAGDEKGKTGVVVKVLREKQRAIVEGLNMVKKHVKPTNEQPEGGIIEKESSIHISNLMLVDPKTGKPTRIGRKIVETGTKKADGTPKVEHVRYAKKSGEIIKVK
jgi:large subunit ribosomal protein L24